MGSHGNDNGNGSSIGALTQDELDSDNGDEYMRYGEILGKYNKKYFGSGSFSNSDRNSTIDTSDSESESKNNSSDITDNNSDRISYTDENENDNYNSEDGDSSLDSNSSSNDNGGRSVSDSDYENSTDIDSGYNMNEIGHKRHRLRNRDRNDSDNDNSNSFDSSGNISTQSEAVLHMNHSNSAPAFSFKNFSNPSNKKRKNNGKDSNENGSHERHSNLGSNNNNNLGSHSRPRLKPNSVGNIEINIQTHHFGSHSHNPSDNYRGTNERFIDSDTRSMIDSPLGIRYMHSLNDINTLESDNDNDDHNHSDDTDNDKDDHHSLSNSNPFSFDKLLSNRGISNNNHGKRNNSQRSLTPDLNMLSHGSRNSDLDKYLFNNINVSKLALSPDIGNGRSIHSTIDTNSIQSIHTNISLGLGHHNFTSINVDTPVSHPEARIPMKQIKSGEVLSGSERSNDMMNIGHIGSFSTSSTIENGINIDTTRTNSNTTTNNNNIILEMEVQLVVLNKQSINLSVKVHEQKAPSFWQ